MNPQEICIAICLIPQLEFDERSAQELIETLSRRIQTSNFRHMEHATNAVEYLNDAATTVECAADDMDGGDDMDDAIGTAGGHFTI